MKLIRTRLGVDEGARGSSARRQRGLTLIELLIAMMLTSLVAAMTIGLFISATRSSTIAQSVDGGTRQAANGMSEMTRMIRAATANPVANPSPGNPLTTPAIVSAAANSITLDAYVNLTGASESPVQVNFAVNAQGQLVETQWPATTTVAGANGNWVFSTTPSSTRILCDSVPASGQLFHYLVAAGTEIAPPAATDTTTLATIRAVQIVLVINSSSQASAPVTLTNTVGMPNLGFTN